jgi:transposase-like protein
MNISQNPYAGRVEAMSEDDFIVLEKAVEARRCRMKIGFGTFDEAAAEYRPRPACPSCGAESVKDGISTSGRQRFLCTECHLRFDSLSQTIFDNCKKDLPTWVKFVECMTWNVQVEAAAEICGISHKTAFEWRHRIFATVDDYQDKIVLKGRIWIDEVYISDTDLTKGYESSIKRGLSKQQICIAVAIDEHKNAVAVEIGHGKPSAKRLKAGLLSHIERGSVVVHDMEKAHLKLIEAAGCDHEAYKADCADPVYLECMSLVNNLCSWLKRYLWRYVGMRPVNLQSYLNWFAYMLRVNNARDKWPKTTRVVRHLLMSNINYRR